MTVSPVLQALYEGKLEEVEELLAGGAELDVFDAAALGRIERLRELLDRDAGLAAAYSSDGFTPLHLAAFFRQPEAAELLVRRGAEIDAAARNTMAVTPLHSAAAGGQTGIAGLLLARGANPNARQQGGFVPLHAAAQNGDIELVELLLEQGADPEATTDDGRTPRDLAAGRDEVIAMLVKPA